MVSRRDRLLAGKLRWVFFVEKEAREPLTSVPRTVGRPTFRLMRPLSNETSNGASQGVPTLAVGREIEAQLHRNWISEHMVVIALVYSAVAVLFIFCWILVCICELWERYKICKIQTVLFGTGESRGSMARPPSVLITPPILVQQPPLITREELGQGGGGVHDFEGVIIEQPDGAILVAMQDLELGSEDQETANPPPSPSVDSRSNSDWANAQFSGFYQELQLALQSLELPPPHY